MRMISKEERFSDVVDLLTAFLSRQDYAKPLLLVIKKDRVQAVWP